MMLSQKNVNVVIPKMTAVRAAVGTELLAHRFEEGAEAVGDAECHGRREEGGDDGQPCPRRVTLVARRSSAINGSSRRDAGREGDVEQFEIGTAVA